MDNISTRKFLKFCRSLYKRILTLKLLEYVYVQKEKYLKQLCIGSGFSKDYIVSFLKNKLEIGGPRLKIFRFQSEDLYHDFLEWSYMYLVSNYHTILLNAQHRKGRHEELIGERH